MDTIDESQPFQLVYSFSRPTFPAYWSTSSSRGILRDHSRRLDLDRRLSLSGPHLRGQGKSLSEVHDISSPSILYDTEVMLVLARNVTLYASCAVQNLQQSNCNPQVHSVSAGSYRDRNSGLPRANTTIYVLPGVRYGMPDPAQEALCTSPFSMRASDAPLLTALSRSRTGRSPNYMKKRLQSSS